MFPYNIFTRFDKIKHDFSQNGYFAGYANTTSAIDAVQFTALGASYMMHGKRHYIQVPLGKTNEGMNLYVKENVIEWSKLVKHPHIITHLLQVFEFNITKYYTSL